MTRLGLLLVGCLCALLILSATAGGLYFFTARTDFLPFWGVLLLGGAIAILFAGAVNYWKR